ncbi:MAG: hypothetical protein LBQ61_04615 [Spirochaetales bacterium]|jgi:hypothetical protein|nr:hypothetical protein [Spirochaetales bacterium]
MRRFVLKKYLGILAGLFMILTGACILLWTVGKVSLALSVFPLLVAGFGILGLYLYFTENVSIALFMGMSCLFLSLFSGIHRIFPQYYLKSAWPLVLFIIGIALLIFSLRKFRKRRIAFLIPALAFIFLALLFLLFSFKLIKMSFLDFVKIWWPGVILLLGMTLLFSSIKKNIKNNKN